MPAIPSGDRAVDTVAAERPLPQFPEPDTEPFWAPTREHRLIYQACRACDQIVFHPRRHCTACLHGQLESRESAGRGTVYTYTVIRQHGHPFFGQRVPYAVGFIDLDEGFRMLAEIGPDPAGRPRSPARGAQLGRSRRGQHPGLPAGASR